MRLLFVLPHGFAWPGSSPPRTALNRCGSLSGYSAMRAPDPSQVAAVVQGEAGKRHYVDRDGDGTPEEVWFIDLDSRHLDTMRPVLVRVIDEDGDLREGDEPDLDSDLYIADWKADGLVDSVTDYTDTDGDQDVNEMGIYFRAGSRQAYLLVGRGHR